MENRIALVIGNGAYSNLYGLKNPVNDARALARALGSLGFELWGGEPLLDADRAEMKSVIDSFCQSLGRRSVALLYYSGHGVQLGGANYLAPVDAGVPREMHIEAELVDVGGVLSLLEYAETLLNIIVLDACRSDPFGGRSFRNASGLAPMSAGRGTIIAYSTQPGNVALDGEGDNSPFVEGLLEALDRPSLEARELFNQAGILVRQRTGGKQVPWVTSSPIDTTFIFNPIQTPVKQELNSLSRGEWWKDAETAPAGGPASTAGPMTGRDQLQQAIDQAASGATIQLPPGVYVGPLRFTQPVTLAGAVTEQVVIETVEDGQPLISVEASSVRLRNLTLRTKGDQSGAVITQGELAMEDCAVTPAVSATRQSAAAIHVAGEASSFRASKCSISGYDCAIYASDGGSVEVEESTVITGRWGADMEATEGRNIAIVAGPGTGVDVSDVSIECFATGIEADLPAALSVTGARFAHCAIGLAISGAEQQYVAEDCEFVDTGIAVKASNSNVAIRKCSIGYLETGILVEAGNVVVERCKRISGPQKASYPLRSCGIWVRGKGAARIVSCRIFGGDRTLDVSDDSTVSGSDCELFGSFNFVVVSKGSLALDSCRIHDGADGLYLGGAAKLASCAIWENKGLGGVVMHGGELKMSNCYVYRNRGAGIQTYHAAKLTIKNTIVTLNTSGLRIQEGDELYLDGCIFLQNVLSGFNPLIGTQPNRAFVERCHFERFGIPALDGHGASPESDSRGNRFRPPLACTATDGSGGYSNSIYHEDILFGEFSRARDLVEGFIRVRLHDWSAETPQVSADGRQVTYVVTRSAMLNDRLKPISVLAKIKEGLSSAITRANIQFDMRIVVLLGTESLAPGLEQVTVTIEEFEEVDRSNMSGYPLGTDYFARSLLTGLQVGCNLLEKVRHSLTPVT